jgi:hypothetical protein
MTKPNELARHVTISLSSAYGNTPYPLSWSEATFLSAPSPAAQRPRSAVGITVSSPLQVAATLAEMTDEYEHYRRTAEDFSEQWRYSHSAVRTIEILQRDDILSANTRAG